MEHYDIFISYKRKSLPTANNLYYRLTTRGYSTFFDLEEMRRDNFNVQLLNYIENAKDVFVILEEGSLDGCKKENWENEDWFCHEIAFALEKKKNIIPILLGGYKMPSEDFLPDKLKGLSLKHSPDFTFSFFDAYLDKLIEKKFITSEARVQNKATSVFKFYSNENSQVFKEGKLVCSLEGMSDEPYYLPVSRKGDYRFKVVNIATQVSQIKDLFIDSDEEKKIQIEWGKHRNKKKNHKKRIVIGGCIVLTIILLLIGYRRVPDLRKLCKEDTTCTNDTIYPWGEALSLEGTFGQGKAAAKFVLNGNNGEYSYELNNNVVKGDLEMERYDKHSDSLVINAYYNGTRNYKGQFKGSLIFSGSGITYTGVFYNHKGKYTVFNFRGK